jgi:hypothetical protein
MTGFLVEYHRPTGDWSVREFRGASGPSDALKASFKLERERKSADFEIAALVSESIEVIKKTHSRYFSGHEREAEFSLRDEQH